MLFLTAIRSLLYLL